MECEIPLEGLRTEFKLRMMPSAGSPADHCWCCQGTTGWPPPRNSGVTQSGLAVLRSRQVTAQNWSGAGNRDLSVALLRSWWSKGRSLIGARMTSLGPGRWSRGAGNFFRGTTADPK